MEKLKTKTTSKKSKPFTGTITEKEYCRIKDIALSLFNDHAFRPGLDFQKEIGFIWMEALYYYLVQQNLKPGFKCKRK